ncbi:MAG: hypothetical protein C0514_02925 [Candidatus Puniceispirillum sp.]|nr:hypothetical protein [Candidatus Puniceispirillum sp.]
MYLLGDCVAIMTPPFFKKTLSVFLSTHLALSPLFASSSSHIDDVIAQLAPQSAAYNAVSTSGTPIIFNEYFLSPTGNACAFHAFRTTRFEAVAHIEQKVARGSTETARLLDLAIETDTQNHTIRHLFTPGLSQEERRARYLAHYKNTSAMVECHQTENVQSDLNTTSLLDVMSYIYRIDLRVYIPEEAGSQNLILFHNKTMRGSNGMVQLLLKRSHYNLLLRDTDPGILHTKARERGDAHLDAYRTLLTHQEEETRLALRQLQAQEEMAPEIAPEAPPESEASVLNSVASPEPVTTLEQTEPAPAPPRPARTVSRQEVIDFLNKKTRSLAGFDIAEARRRIWRHAEVITQRAPASAKDTIRLMNAALYRSSLVLDHHYLPEAVTPHESLQNVRDTLQKALRFAHGHTQEIGRHHNAGVHHMWVYLGRCLARLGEHARAWEVLSTTTTDGYSRSGVLEMARLILEEGYRPDDMADTLPEAYALTLLDRPQAPRAGVSIHLSNSEGARERMLFPHTPYVSSKEGRHLERTLRESAGGTHASSPSASRARLSSPTTGRASPQTPSLRRTIGHTEASSPQPARERAPGSQPLRRETPHTRLQISASVAQVPSSLAARKRPRSRLMLEEPEEAQERTRSNAAHRGASSNQVPLVAATPAPQTASSAPPTKRPRSNRIIEEPEDTQEGSPSPATHPALPVEMETSQSIAADTSDTAESMQVSISATDTDASQEDSMFSGSETEAETDVEESAAPAHARSQSQENEELEELLMRTHISSCQGKNIQTITLCLEGLEKENRLSNPLARARLFSYLGYADFVGIIGQVHHNRIDCFVKAYALAKDLGDNALIATILIGLGNTRLNTITLNAKTYTVTDCFLEAVCAARDAGDTKLTSNAFVGLGNAKFSGLIDGEPYTDILCYKKAYEIAQNNSDFKTKALALIGLGNTDFGGDLDGRHYDKAACFLKAFHYAKILKDDRIMTQACMGLGHMHYAGVLEGEQQTQQSLYKKAHALAVNCRDNRLIAQAWLGLGSAGFEGKIFRQYYTNDDCRLEALRFANMTKDPKLISQAWIILGNALYNGRIGGKRLTPVACLQEGLRIATESGLKKQMAQAWFGLGNARYSHISQGRVNANSYCYIECLKLAQDLGNKKLMAQAWLGLGNARFQGIIDDKTLKHKLYAGKENTYTSIECFQEALHYATLVKHIRIMSQALVGLGNAHFKGRVGGKDYTPFLCFLEGLDLAIQQKDSKLIVRAWLGLGNSEYKGVVDGKHYTNRECRHRARELAEKLGDKKLLAQTLMSLGNSSCGVRETQKALDYFNDALKVAKSANDKKLIGDIMKRISATERFLPKRN